MNDDPTWGDADMPDILEPAVVTENSETGRQQNQHLQSVRANDSNSQAAQLDATTPQDARQIALNDGGGSRAPKYDPMDPRYYIVKRLDIHGRHINLQEAQRTPNWYDLLETKRRREVGFWNAQMVAPFPLKVKDTKDEVFNEYKYGFFMTFPAIINPRPESPKDNAILLQGRVMPKELQVVLQDLYEYSRTGELSPPYDSPEELIANVEAVLASMEVQHDKNMETLKYKFETPPVTPVMFRNGKSAVASPYAGPAPAPGEVGHLGRMNESQPVLNPGVHGASTAVQHIMDLLQSSTLAVDPNSIGRVVIEEGDDEIPLPRATPVCFPFSATPTKFPDPAEFGRQLHLAPSWVSSRFLAPDRHAFGPRGLGPYYVEQRVAPESQKFFVDYEGGPAFFGDDAVAASRYPNNAARPQRATATRRARVKTDNTNYTRRRAPAKKMAKPEETGDGAARGRGSGRARGGGGGRVRAGRRGSRRTT